MEKNSFSSLKSLLSIHRLIRLQIRQELIRLNDGIETEGVVYYWKAMVFPYFSMFYSFDNRELGKCKLM